MWLFKSIDRIGYKFSKKSLRVFFNFLWFYGVYPAKNELYEFNNKCTIDLPISLIVFDMDCLNV